MRHHGNVRVLLDPSGAFCLYVVDDPGPGGSTAGASPKRWTLETG